MSEVTGPQLRERREKLGLDRRPVAVAAGMTVAQLCTIEAGGKRDKVIARIPDVDKVITKYETSGVPAGTNKRRGRREGADAATTADAGEEGDPASAEPEAVDTEVLPDPTPGLQGRWAEWREFRKGDAVATSVYPGAAFEFVAYVQPMGGKPYVDLWGGKRGHEQLRAIDPETVRKVNGKGPGRKYADSTQTDMKPNRARHRV